MGEPAPQQRPLTSAGWYPDPAETGRLRYFDGSVWTGRCAANPSGNMPRQVRRRNTLIAFALASFVLVLVVVIAGGGESQDGDTAAPAKLSTLVQAPVAPDLTPALAPAPHVTSLPLDFAAAKNGISLDASDIARHFVDGVDTERVIVDKSNWRIAAQCDQMAGTTLTVGVIRAEEFTAIADAGQGAVMSDNWLRDVLNCP